VNSLLDHSIRRKLWSVDWNVTGTSELLCRQPNSAQGNLSQRRGKKQLFPLCVEGLINNCRCWRGLRRYWQDWGRGGGSFELVRVSRSPQRLRSGEP